MKFNKMRSKDESQIEKEWDDFFREYKESDSDDEKKLTT
jgi:hypothetical protein